MSPTINRCLLCLSSCKEFQSLLDGGGLFNAAYEIAIKYFDPMFLQSGQDNTSSIICIECWELIKDFHTFQEWIIKTQLQFREHSSYKGDQTQQAESAFIKETVIDSSQQIAVEQTPPSDVSHSYSTSDFNDTKLTQNCQDLHILQPYLFPCNICGESFKSVHNLDSHKNKIHLETRNICRCKKSKDLYAKSAPDIQNCTIDYYKVICCPLKQKMLKNDSLIEKCKGVLECGVCKETFPYYSILRLHFKYDHPNDKFFIMCCERKFQQLAITMEHIRLHLDPNIFKCKICDLCYSAKSCLMNHIKGTHDKAKLKWSCKICNKVFQYQASLMRHKEFEH